MPLRNGIRPGDWLFQCMQCAKTIYGSEVRVQWDNLKVCSNCFDPKHPQLNLRSVRDDQTVPFANPPGTPHFLGVNEVNFTLDVEVVADDGVQSPVLSPSGATVLASS